MQAELWKPGFGWAGEWFEGEGAGREESQVEKEAEADETCSCYELTD